MAEEKGDRNMKKGFTLIELLVVVLIIGILASIALPQYQKAVLKSRMAEVAIRVKAMEQAIDLYVLENDYPSSGKIDVAEANPDWTGGLTKKEENCENSGAACYGSKYAWYFTSCDSSACYVEVIFSKSGNPSVTTPNNDIMRIHRSRIKTSGWTNGLCTYGTQDNDGPGICSAIPGYTPDRD